MNGICFPSGDTLLWFLGETQARYCGAENCYPTPGPDRDQKHRDTDTHTHHRVGIPLGLADREMTKSFALVSHDEKGTPV